jgi:major histocompatibility complex class I
VHSVYGIFITCFYCGVLSSVLSLINLIVKFQISSILCHYSFVTGSKRDKSVQNPHSVSGKNSSWAVLVHAFNPSTWEAEAGGFLSPRPAWSTE